MRRRSGGGVTAVERLAGTRVLVTGAGGFLGGELCGLLRRQGADVVAATRAGGSGALACDLADPAGVLRLLERSRPEAVVNCAAEVDFAAPLSRLYATNVLAAGILAHGCAAAGGYLVQLSSVAVYGVRAERIAADSAPAPDTGYGRSKLLADELVAASGCPAAVLRPSGIFGAGGPAHLGLNRAIAAARRGEAPTVVGSGRALRSYVSVHDAARAVAHCLAHRVTGVHLVAAPEPQSIAALLQSVCDAFLPGSRPVAREGVEAADQVVIPGPVLPPARPFAEALRELHADRAAF